jgi:hypothetical protein
MRRIRYISLETLFDLTTLSGTQSKGRLNVRRYKHNQKWNTSVQCAGFEPMKAIIGGFNHGKI